MLPKSVVDHIFACCAELLVALDHLVDRLDQVLLSYGLAAVPDREHPCFRAHRAQLRPSRVRAETSQQLVTDPLLHRHSLRVDLENMHPPLQVRKSELNFTVDTPRTHQSRV